MQSVERAGQVEEFLNLTCRTLFLICTRAGLMEEGEGRGGPVCLCVCCQK